MTSSYRKTRDSQAIKLIDRQLFYSDEQLFPWLDRRNILTEKSYIPIQFLRDFADGIKCDVALSPFNAAVVASIQIGNMRKSFLRESLGFSLVSDPFS